MCAGAYACMCMRVMHESASAVRITACLCMIFYHQFCIVDALKSSIIHPLYMRGKEPYMQFNRANIYSTQYGAEGFFQTRMMIESARDSLGRLSSSCRNPIFVSCTVI